MRWPKRAFAVYCSGLGIGVAALSTPGVLDGSTMGLEGENSYTVELAVTALADGRTIHATETLARRSDGAMVHIYRGETAKSPSKWTNRKTVSFDDGISVEIDDEEAPKATIAQDPVSGELETRTLDEIDPASDCQKNFRGKSWGPAPLTVEAHEPIHGYDAVRVRFTEANGNIVTQWRSPQFACEVIQQDTVMRNGTVEHEVPVILQIGEPDSTLFELPASYNGPGSATGHAANRKHTSLTSALR